MKLLRNVATNLSKNAAEYYTLLVLIVAIPFCVGVVTELKWGLLLSFVVQGVIGVLYIRGKS